MPKVLALAKDLTDKHEETKIAEKNALNKREEQRRVQAVGPPKVGPRFAWCHLCEPGLAGTSLQATWGQETKLEAALKVCRTQRPPLGRPADLGARTCPRRR